MTRQGALKINISAFIAAVCIVALGASVYPTLKEADRESAPVSDWFTVDELIVPNFELGDSPIILFQRTIKQEVKGSWVVEVQSVNADNAFQYVCGGHGENNYSPADSLPDPVTWDWFVWDKGTCDNIAPGDYRLEVRWDFCKDNWPCKSLIEHSNVFEILARK